MANPYSYTGPGERWAEGDPTAEDYLNVSRINADANRWTLTQLVDDADDPTALLIAPSSLEPETTLSYPDSVLTGTDENAVRVIFVDLDDPNTIWDYVQFMQLIQHTSWHAANGDPPVHGLMWIPEDGDTIVWWNRETAAVYMTFASATTGQVYSNGDLADLAFIDGKIVACDDVSTYGVALVDLVQDRAYLYHTGGFYTNDVDLTSQAAFTVFDSSIALGNAQVKHVGIIRDISRTDVYGRPEHKWAAGTAGSVDVYEPADDALYNEDNNPVVVKMGVSVDGILAFARNAARDILYINELSTIIADWNNSGQGYLDNSFWTGGMRWPTVAAGATDAIAVADGKSIAQEGNGVVYVATGGGLWIHHMWSPRASPTAGVDSDFHAGNIRMAEGYASPYMKGTVLGCWPLHAVTDVGYRGHNLTNNNTVTFSDGGPAGSYANFVAASSQWLSLADHADFGLLDGITIALWAYRDLDSGSFETLVSKYDTTAATDSFLLRVTSADVIELRLNTNAVATSTWTMPTGEWVYLVATWDGTTAKIWANGIEVASGAFSTQIANSAAELYIGAVYDGTDQDHFWDGRIGGVMISATAMTEREIEYEYWRGLRRIDSTAETNDTISDNDCAALAVDPYGKYVAYLGVDKTLTILDEFHVPVSTDTYGGTTARDVAVKSMPGGADPHYVMAGSDQLEIVQPDPRGF